MVMDKLMAMIKLKIREAGRYRFTVNRGFLPLDIPIGFLCLVHFKL
jgi:hypothetical protein